MPQKRAALNRPIDDYLKATRGPTYSRANPTLGAVYARYQELAFDALVGLADSDLPPPGLYVVYTSQAQIETIRIRDETFIIFDQYLGQVLNRLNRLFFEGASPGEVDAYLYKLSALLALSTGSPEAALLNAAVFDSVKDRLSKSSLSIDDVAVRAVYTRVAEIFIICHELVHYVYKSDTKAARRLQDDYFEIGFQLADVADTLLPTAAPSYLDDYDRAWKRRIGPLPEITKSERSELESQLRYPDPKQAHFSKMLQSIKADSHLTEECVADAIAGVITSWIVDSEISSALDTAVRGCSLALHNLRLITYLRDLVQGAPESFQTRGLTETITRVSAFRLVCPRWPILGSQDLSAEAEQWRVARKRLLEELTADNVKFSEILMDQLIFFFDPNQRKSLSNLRHEWKQSGEAPPVMNLWLRSFVESTCNFVHVDDWDHFLDQITSHEATGHTTA
jgi:hypothetical protein